MLDTTLLIAKIRLLTIANNIIKMQLIKIIPLIFLTLLGATHLAEASPTQHADSGIRFSCKPGQIEPLASAFDAYLASLGIGPELITKSPDMISGTVVYSLNATRDDTSTLSLKDNPAMRIKDETVTLPAKNGTWQKIQTVSRKEIMLALLQRGRLTEFKDDACDLAALKDHVGIRQNIAAWAENLNWIWPDGSPAIWNSKYWNNGTPKRGISLHRAVNDMFMNQEKYSIGCYTATKVVVIQGVLDYYRRVKKDPVQLKLLENRLTADKEPLVNIEPGKMWAFEHDFDPKELNRQGKLVRLEYGIAPRNFVPGDWVYFLNTDPVSYQKTGYEGSTAIYLGRNKFSDYFNDHHHAYSYQQKVNEVFQWRNGVFNRIRDAAKAKPLTTQDIENLSRTPAEGGIVTDIRVFPYFFGYEILPVVTQYAGN